MRVLALVAIGALLIAACGREDVLLAPEPVVVGDAGAEAGATPPLLLPDGGTATVCTTERACRTLDAPCATGNECCSGRCEGGRCLPIGACKAPAAACATRAECCSGRCEPIAGTTNRACTNLCRATGAACVTGSDCCSFSCRNNACVAEACRQEGDDCTSVQECCSGACSGGKCRLDSTALCRATGEDCTSGGGGPCCYGCTDGRCDLGPGPCRPRGAPCVTTADCCAGTCVEGADKARFCTSACVAEGASCTQSADCCSGACTSSSTGKCAASASTCSLVGEACNTGPTCCTGSCFDGRCADNCPASVR